MDGRDDTLRDWELAFRIAEIVWPLVGDHPSVLERRRTYLRNRRSPPVPCSECEASQFTADVAPMTEWLAAKWCLLFDEGAQKGQDYVFPDGFAVLTTLSPLIIRPALQRGVFVRDIPAQEQPRLERFRFTFHHHHVPVWNGLGNIPFGSPVPLGKYLYPLSDPIERIAARHTCRFRP